jgi:hypothetical protein
MCSAVLAGFCPHVCWAIVKATMWLRCKNIVPFTPATCQLLCQHGRWLLLSADLLSLLQLHVPILMNIVAGDGVSRLTRSGHLGTAA